MSANPTNDHLIQWSWRGPTSWIISNFSRELRHSEVSRQKGHFVIWTDKRWTSSTFPWSKPSDSFAATLFEWALCQSLNILRSILQYFLYFGESLSTKVPLHRHFSAFKNEILPCPQSLANEFDIPWSFQSIRIPFGRQMKACFSFHNYISTIQYSSPYFIGYTVSSLRLDIVHPLHVRCI